MATYRYIKRRKRVGWTPTQRRDAGILYSPRVIMADTASNIVSSDNAPSTNLRIFAAQKKAA